MHPEGAAAEVDIVAGVLNLHQPLNELIPADLHAGAHAHHHAFVLAGVAHGVNAADAGNDNHVLALAHGSGGAVAQPVDLLVDGGILFDVGIAGGDVGLGLVVVVIADEIFHRAVREKGAQLAAQLGGQRFVVGQHQRGLLDFFDDGGHGEGFAAAGNAQQHLILEALLYAVGQRFNSGRLIASGRVGRFQNKFVHGMVPFLCVASIIARRCPCAKCMVCGLASLGRNRPFSPPSDMGMIASPPAVDGRRNGPIQPTFAHLRVLTG